MVEYLKQQSAASLSTNCPPPPKKEKKIKRKVVVQSKTFLFFQKIQFLATQLKKVVIIFSLVTREI